MFTGIVEETGPVREISSRRLMVGAQKVLEGTRAGDSLAVNGACLTVVASDKDSFTVEVMPETWRLTNLGKLHYGDLVNLERALTLGSRIGGHIMQGHVDNVGKIVSMTPEGEAVIMKVALPPELSRYIAVKGFVAVDGVSLTVTDVDDSFFRVSLVGYTRHNTNLAQRKPGDMVNLEVDILAKYIEKYLQNKKQGLTLEFLNEYGYSKAG